MYKKMEESAAAVESLKKAVEGFNNLGAKEDAAKAQKEIDFITSQTNKTI